MVNASFCYELLELRMYGLQIFEFTIGLPCIFFVLFMLWRVKSALDKLRQTESLIISTYYTFVWVVSVTQLARFVFFSVVSHVEKNPWVYVFILPVNFLLVFTEISVVIHKSHRYTVSGREALKQTALISGIISSATVALQATLVFMFSANLWPPDGPNRKEISLFWAIYHCFWFVLYCLTLIVPHTKYKNYLPRQPTFFNYIRAMFLTHIIQIIGNFLIYTDFDFGFCLTDVGFFLFYSLFGPLLYYCFLYEFFRDINLPSYYQEMIYNGYLDTDT